MPDECVHLVTQIEYTEGPFVDEDNGMIYYVDTVKCTQCGATWERRFYPSEEL